MWICEFLYFQSNRHQKGKTNNSWSFPTPKNIISTHTSDPAKEIKLRFRWIKKFDFLNAKFQLHRKDCLKGMPDLSKEKDPTKKIKQIKIA